MAQIMTITRTHKPLTELQWFLHGTDEGTQLRAVDPLEGILVAQVPLAGIGVLVLQVTHQPLVLCADTTLLGEPADRTSKACGSNIGRASQRL